MSPQPPGEPGSATPSDPLERVLALIRHLRVHCPWDADQTARSLVPHLLEEAHEVAEAVRAGAPPGVLADELGDLLLNVAYQIVVAEETGAFDAEQVTAALERKMVRRHPHVDWEDFSPRLARLVRTGRAAALQAGDADGDASPHGAAPAHQAGDADGAAPPHQAGDPDGAAPAHAGAPADANAAGAGEPGATAAPPDPRSSASARAWERRKAAERPGASILHGLARGLDPLTRAHRVQERVAAVGFDWDDLDGPADKIAEELDEARDALARRRAGGGSAEAAEEELGDLLFAVVNLARRAGVHPANALASANAKFERRFRALEALLAGEGRAAGDLTLAELDALWDRVKAAEALRVAPAARDEREGPG